MELLSYKGVSRIFADQGESTIRRRVQDGTLPAPIVLSRRKDGQPARVGFVRADVEAAIARLVDRSRVAERRSPETA